MTKPLIMKNSSTPSQPYEANRARPGKTTALAAVPQESARLIVVKWNNATMRAAMRRNPSSTASRRRGRDGVVATAGAAAGSGSVPGIGCRS